MPDFKSNPGLSANNIGDRHLVNSIFSREFFLGVFSSGINSSYFIRDFVIKLSCAMSIFINHVSHVFGVASKKQMIWIYATRVIAHMKNINGGFWYFIKNRPRYSMGLNNFAFYSKSSISFFITTSLPFPTLIRRANSYLIPESLHLEDIA